MTARNRVRAPWDGQPIALAADHARRGRGVLPRTPKNETIALTSTAIRGILAE
jgi:hypothetical protein